MKKIALFICLLVLALKSEAQLSVGIIMQTNISCFSGCNGALTVAATGGVPPYSYYWTPNNVSGPSVGGLCAGSYTCTVTDAASNSAQVIATLTQPATPVVANVTVSTITTCAGSPVTISATGTGGVGAYTYSWAPASSLSSATIHNPSASPLVPTNYTVTVTDANGCSATNTVQVNVQANPTVTITGNSPICSGGCRTLSASGAWTYVWQPGSITGASITVCPLTTTTYTVTGTAPNGCVSTAVATLNVINSPVVATATASSSVVCIGGNTQLSCSVTGGTSPYTYLWLPGSLTGTPVTVSPAATTAYTVQVTDVNFCTSQSVVVVTIDNTQVTGDTIIETTCNGATGQAWLALSNNLMAASYLWNTVPQQNNYIATGLQAGNYTCTVTTVNGCTVTGNVTVGDSCDFVWPGDADDDGVANMNDFLAIGVANGTTGTTRPNATLSWIGQPSAPWGQTLLSGTDYKWVDCDGNGTINQNDTLAITQNFGYTHNNRFGDIHYLSAPDLKLVVSADTLGSGTSGTVSVMLGDAVNPANNIYGISFRLNYDATQIVPGSVGLNTSSSWLGTTGTDMMAMRVNGAAGMTDAGIVRLDQQDRSGNGLIAQMPFRISNALTGTGNNAAVAFWLSNVNVISAGEMPVAVNAMNDTVVILDNGIMLGTNTISKTESITLYPNPAGEVLNIVLPAGVQKMKMELCDVSGRMVRTEQISGSGTAIIHRSETAPGLYLCRLISEDGKIFQSRIVFR